MVGIGRIEKKIRSMRLPGPMLQQENISPNTSNQFLVGNKELPSEKPTLSDLGITKNESSTYQKS
jgi:hypothetical protein